MSSPRVGISGARRLALVAFGIAVGIVGAEIGLHLAQPSLGFHFPTARLTDEQFTRRADQVSDGNGVRYTFDAAGFRTSAAPTPPTGTPAILFIGDSFTQGFGVGADETFAAVTCAQLLQRGIPARCLNAGVSGFGTAHELRLLQRLLQRDDLGIAAVVFQLCPYNDLRDNWEDGGFGIEGDRLAVWDPPHVPIEIRLRDGLLDNALARHSSLVILLANAWVAAVPIDEKSDASMFALERRLVGEVVQTTQARRIPIVLLVAAPAWEVEQTSSQPYDEPGRANFMAAVAQEAGVPWLDSRALARAPEHYLPNDGHFSPAGNALIGAALAEQLTPLLKPAPAQPAP